MVKSHTFCKPRSLNKRLSLGPLSFMKFLKLLTASSYCLFWFLVLAFLALLWFPTNWEYLVVAEVTSLSKYLSCSPDSFFDCLASIIVSLYSLKTLMMSLLSSLLSPVQQMKQKENNNKHISTWITPCLNAYLNFFGTRKTFIQKNTYSLIGYAMELSKDEFRYKIYMTLVWGNPCSISEI